MLGDENISALDLFLSTPSARRATSNRFKMISKSSGISIHALREEGDYDSPRRHTLQEISIHALREEGDCS